MSDTATSVRFDVHVVYNGVAHTLAVEPHEAATAVLNRAIESFHIVQNRHLLSLYAPDGAPVPEVGSAEQAGIYPGEELLLRQNQVKGGVC